MTTDRICRDLCRLDSWIEQRINDTELWAEDYWAGLLVVVVVIGGWML